MSTASRGFLLARAIAGSILILGLVFDFVVRRWAPVTIVTESSTILPVWVGWAAYLFTLMAAFTYNLTDYLEWWGRRR